MPRNLNDLYDRIVAETRQQDLTDAQAHYAIGYLLFDVFERARHEKDRKNCEITGTLLDELAAEMPSGRIVRGVAEAESEFGTAAANFMDAEIERQINLAIERSIVSEVKAYTGSAKAFFLNVLSGIVAGFVFAIILYYGDRLWERDPSPKQVFEHMSETGPSQPAVAPVAPAPSPGPPK